MRARSASRVRRARAGAAAALAVALALATGLAGGCERGPSGVVGNPRVVVLGFDGVDPRLLERLRARGRLPNVEDLVRSGAERRLATTEPPECAVAWSTFATGLPPARHGIFAPLRRDPATYALEDATLSLEEPELVLGLPFGAARAVRARRGASFWETADAHGVRSVVLRAPYDVSPEALSHGRVLSGVGVPDAGLGRVAHRLVTTAAAPGERFGGARGAVDRVAWEGDVARTRLPGLAFDGRSGGGVALSLVRVGERLRIEIGEHWVLLKPGEWSEWTPVTFPVSSFFSVAATVRFHLDELAPDLRLYVSPPNLDPRDPLVRIGTPATFPGELASRLGLFGTHVAVGPGYAYDAGDLGEKAFVEELTDSLGWARRATLHQIDQRDAELVVAIFTETDRVAHMFWRGIDDAGAAAGGDRDDLVEHSYRAMDRIIGDVRRHLPASTRLLVLSDHGFHRFRTGLDVDAWLESEGLLHRRGGEGPGGAEIDWSRTRAYAVGNGPIDLNLAGREARGIVAPGEEAEAILARISERLRALRDESTGERVVAEVQRGAELFAGPFVERAPDLLVSFQPGYRTTFAADLGAPDARGLVANPSRWTGDHGAQSASDTPGVLLSSAPLRSGEASLEDVAPTVLEWLGVPVPEDLPGRSLAPSAESSARIGSRGRSRDVPDGRPDGRPEARRARSVPGFRTLGRAAMQGRRWKRTSCGERRKRWFGFTARSCGGSAGRGSATSPSSPSATSSSRARWARSRARSSTRR